LRCDYFAHARAFARAAKLLTNALQVPESLERWLSKPEFETDFAGVLANAGVNQKSEHQKQERGASIGRKIP
jgi:hypothetical protein